MSVETLKGLEAELSSWSPEELSVCAQPQYLETQYLAQYSKVFKEVI